MWEGRTKARTGGETVRCREGQGGEGLAMRRTGMERYLRCGGQKETGASGRRVMWCEGLFEAR